MLSLVRFYLITLNSVYMPKRRVEVNSKNIYDDARDLLVDDVNPTLVNADKTRLKSHESNLLTHLIDVFKKERKFT